MAIWNIKNKQVEVKIGYAFARGKLKKDFGINLLALFEGENIDAFTRAMTLEDEKIENIAWHFAEKQFDDKEKFFNSFESIQELEDFKTAFWDAIGDFFEPTKKAMLQEVRQSLPKLFLEMMKSKMEELQNDILPV